MNESIMGKEEEEGENQDQNHTKITTTTTWGTWEELLLACAVKRHGFKNWDLVSMEVQARSCLPQILTTPDVCQQKYHDLNRRFTSTLAPASAAAAAPKDHKGGGAGGRGGDSYFHNNHNNNNTNNIFITISNNNNNNNNNNNEQVDNTTTTTTTSSATTTTSGGAGGGGSGDGDGEQAANIPWLEELRQLRVAELKQEVHRYDVSILSLQLKVKRLEEEREKSVSLQDDNKIQIQIQTKPSEQQQQQQQRHQQEQKPDLNDDDGDRSDNHKSDDHRHRFLLKPSSSPDESDRENRSVNESNSTASEDKGAVKLLSDVDAVQAASVQQASLATEIGRDESYELDDSVTQQSSEAQSQSSASLGRKRKREQRRNRRREVEGCGGGGDGFKGKDVPTESQPLIGLLELIRAHKHGSFFESRLQTQETEGYKDIVRQHMDLETLQRKLDQGFYTSHHLFHRDLLLLFNNATVFFPESSVESLAAQELRSLVLLELRKETLKSDAVLEQHTPSIPPLHTAELEGSDSLLARHNSSVPIVVCRKRSSMSAKPSTSSSLGQKNEQQRQSKEDKAVCVQKPPVAEQASLNMKSKEKPVTGVRSSRRSNKNFAKVTNTLGKKQSLTSPVMKDGKVDKAESSKSERKKMEPSASDKKRSAANFLKRIKKNSPAETLKKNNRGVGDGGGESKKDNSGKGDRGKEPVLRKNSDRRQVKEESSPVRKTAVGPSKKVAEVSKASSKRGREGGRREAEDVAKKPRKRSRR